jgi:hypothetical protein
MVTVTSMTKLMTVEASRVHGEAAGCSTVAQVSAVYEFNGGGELLPRGARRRNDGGEELGIKGERNGSGSRRIIYLWVREVEQRIPRPAERSAMAGLRSCRTTKSEEGERELTRGPAQQGASSRAEDGPVGWFIFGGPKAGSEAQVSLLPFSFSFMSPFSYFVLF